MKLAIACALVAGCYSPSYIECAINCKASQDCPSGLMCVADRCVGDPSTMCATHVDAPVPVFREVALIPVTNNYDLDLLFVLDDSPGMNDLLNRFTSKIAPFLSELAAVPIQGLPNVHIGVVTSDLGTKGSLDATAGNPIGTGAGSCSGTGKSGALQTNGSTLVNGNFISDIRNPDASRATNYSGTLQDAFMAIANVGNIGCGFEQHIEAAKRALSNNPTNSGFLRANAGLGIFFVADEDDCSMAHSSLLGPDPTLGALQSFRCTRFGITCDGGGSTTDEMNSVGPKTGCHSNESSAYLDALSGYDTFFKGLKADPRTVMIGAIVGSTTPFAVELRPPASGGVAIPALAHACMTLLSAPDPGVRFAELMSKFSRGTFESACNADLTNSMLTFARQLRNVVGDTCIAVDLPPAPNCKVFDTVPGSELELPECTSTGTTDCYSLVLDAARCPSGQHFRLDVRRTTVPANDVMVSVRCAG